MLFFVFFSIVNCYPAQCYTNSLTKNGSDRNELTTARVSFNQKIVW